MSATCGDELTCDMAETYHVLNWRELPLKTAATLAIGLHEDSRTVRKMSGKKLTLDTELRAHILDQLRLLVWSKTRDAGKNRNRPKSVYEILTTEKKEKKVTGFASPEAFERRRAQIIAEV